MCECRSRINFLQAPLIKLKNCSEKFREREILNVIQELKHEKIRHLNYRREFALGVLKGDGQDGQDEQEGCIYKDTIHILERYTHDQDDSPILEFRKLQKMIDHLKLYIQEEIDFRNDYILKYETYLKPFLELGGKLQTVSYLTGQDREADRLEKIKKEKAKKNKRKTRN